VSFSGKEIQRCSYALLIAYSLGCFSCGDCVETPSIASITPTSATVGSPPLVLVVNGNNLRPNSTVNWNGIAAATIFVNGHQLKATIPAEDLAAPAVVKITVFSPPQSFATSFETSGTPPATSSVTGDCAGGTSNVLNFTVNP
jgi:hypothetical protein